MHKVEIKVPLVIYQFGAQHGHIEVVVPLVFHHGCAPEGVEVAHVASPVKVIGDEAGIVVEVVVVDVGRVGDLRNEGMVAVVGDVGSTGRQLEAVDVAPEVGGEVDVDGRSVVFEATEGHGIFTETDAPVLVGHVVEIEEVGVVEESHRAGIGDDTLLEVIAEATAEVSAEHEVKIFAVESQIGRGISGGDFAIGADFQFELVEHLAPMYLCVGFGRNRQHECCYCNS